MMIPLPQPNDPFAWVQASAGPALVCRPLGDVAAHLFTTRTWTLGSGASQLDSAHGWADVAAALQRDAGRLVRARQVHGADVLVAHEASGLRSDADIIVSRNPALALAVASADCVPLLIADRRTGAVAAAHAGWRGTAARVAGAAVAALAGEFGCRPDDLIAAAGPSVGSCCYEVGVDVRERFSRAGFTPAELERWFRTAPTPTSANPSMARVAPGRDHWFFDAWGATRDQLVAAGLAPGRVFIAELCTASHPDTFCSYRRDGAPAGRLAGAIRPGPLRP